MLYPPPRQYNTKLVVLTQDYTLLLLSRQMNSYTERISNSFI